MISSFLPEDNSAYVTPISQRLSLHLPECLQHLLLVVIEASVYLADPLVLYHPQLTLCLLDQPGIVTHQYHT